MSFQHQTLTTVKNSAGVFGTSTVTTTGDAEDNFNFTTASSTTNDPHLLSIAHATIVDAILVVSGACVITTNSATTPANVFTFTGAGVLNGANLFTADVTEIFITNSATTAVTVNVSILRTV